MIEYSCRSAGLAVQMHALPDLLERGQLDVLAEAPEGMHVAVAEEGPVLELDAQLEGALGLAQELVLVDAEHRVEANDARDRGLTDADDADLVGLDHGDRHPGIRDLCQRCRRHPAGRAAAEDDDAAHEMLVHFGPPTDRR